jgi:hypothetical protein
MDVRLLGGDEANEQRDSTQKPSLLLYRITVVAEML